MKHIATVPAAIVKAAMLFQAKQDVRYYLNGIYIAAEHVVATDGHTMLVCPYESDLRPEKPMIIAINGKISSKAYNLELLYDDESEIGVVRCVGPTPTSIKIVDPAKPESEWEEADPKPIAVLDKSGHQEKVFFHKIEAKYPDWRRVIPNGEPVPTSQIGLDFNYCDRVAKASKELGSHFAQCVVTLYGAETTIEVEIKSHGYPGAKAYIMPCRM